MIRIAQDDGSFLKIKRRSKRKSTGRKRGRPRKKIEEPVKLSKKRPYSIILTSRGKQKKCIKTFRTENEAYQYFQQLIDDNTKIKFPVKYINIHGFVEAKYELYIIKKIGKEEIKETTYLRNDYGELIKHVTNSENWQVIDKTPWDIEESFWVHGFNPTFERKDYQWILDNLIIGTEGFFFKNILIYHNKLIIDKDGEIDIVFCKNKPDAYRLYTMIEEDSVKLKFKNIMFSGNLSDYSKATVSSWMDKLCEVTGFNRKKIKRNSLRP